MAERTASKPQVKWQRLFDLERYRALRVSEHALGEAYKEGLRGSDIIHAILNGRVIEVYPARRRVLILGPTTAAARADTFWRVPLHVVCDCSNREEIVAVTVYIPSRKRWSDNLKTRSELDAR